jgi:putative ABC transport system ATP-binding protein
MHRAETVVERREPNLEVEMAILQAQKLSRNYRMGTSTVNALAEVDLSVEAGKFVAVMGPSGSGKSTLLHLLGGLDRPSSGAVILEGQRLSDLPDRQVTLLRRRKIGFVFQFFNLLPTLSAAENVTLPLLIDHRRPADHQARIDELLDLVELSDRRDHRPDQLSGGEQQRVAIARALVTEPAIVLADEPTGNLDTRSGDEVLRLMRRTCDEQGQTIVMVTHDPRAASHADRIVFLKDGRMAGEAQLTVGGDTGAILHRLAELEV